MNVGDDEQRRGVKGRPLTIFVSAVGDDGSYEDEQWSGGKEQSRQYFNEEVRFEMRVEDNNPIYVCSHQRETTEGIDMPEQ